MQLIDPTTGRVVWDSADPYAGPVPPAPEGRQWQVVGDMTPKAPAPQASGLDYYLGGTGIPNKLAMLNQMFNPVEAMGQSMQAGRRMLSPGRGGWDRVADAGNMLSGVAGVVAPTYAAARGGMPAANALAETMTGLSMTPQANALAGFAADESGALRLYHGSPHDFDEFNLEEAGRDYFWFSNDKDYSEGLAGRTNLSRRNKGVMFDVDLNISNPYEVDVSKEASSLADDLGIDIGDHAALEEAWRGGSNFESMVDMYEPQMRAGGHDGIVFKNTLDGFHRPTDQYVVFDDKLISIVRKYGIAGAAAMLGVSVADVEQAMAQEPQ